MGFQEYLNNAPKLTWFCQNGKLLDGHYDGHDDHVFVTHDSDEAEQLSCDNEKEGWIGLTEDEYIKLGFNCPHWFYLKVDNVLIDPLREKTDDIELVKMIPNLWDDVSTVIRYCLSNRNSAHPRQFFDMIERAYLSGGWPCGLKGKYPGGKLVVFSRKLSIKEKESMETQEMKK
ncbi:MAG: hypothetical protein LBU11_07410 [Zoogloeaceae bacterium]|jgi:hypothetical protein|nr:hypothetical protein [Zoogloeaceae bacterium]